MPESKNRQRMKANRRTPLPKKKKKNFKPWIVLSAFVLLLAGLITLLVLKPWKADGVKIDFEPDYYADIKIYNYGTITVALDADSAPITVENFVTLAREGYYDASTFHRIIEGFMMQGGYGTGTADTIKGEFSANGVDNPLKHTRGAISMARTDASYNTATSQFFICQTTEGCQHLDGNYACFGYVIKGLKVMDKVIADAEPTDSNGTISTDKQPIIESITIREP